MPDPSVFERVVAEALFNDTAGGSSGLDDMLAAICEHNARTVLHALATSDEVRAALVDVIGGVLVGIDADEVDDERGWWETSTGAEFGTRKRDELPDAILAAIRPEAT